MRGTLVAALAAAVLAVAGITPARGERGCPSAPAFGAGALGAIAFWRAGALHVVDVATGRDRTLFQPSRRSLIGSEPRWSRDGRWIAVGDTVVAAAGGGSCVPFGRGVSDLQWLPGNRLAALAKRTLLVGGPGRATRVVARSVEGGVVDPAGRRLVSSGPNRTLWVVTLATGKRRLLYHSPSDVVGLPIPRAWSRDGRWILFANDEFGSGSIAADGLPLLAIPAQGGRRVRVEEYVLLARDFLQPCGANRWVVSAGFDRYVSAHKHVDLVSPPTWKPRNVSRDASRSWFSAACSPDGRWIAASVTRNRDEGRFDTAERSIWLLSIDRSRRWFPFLAPGHHVSDEAPRWSRDGRWILYVEHRARPYPRGRLYLVSTVNGVRRGPIATIDGGLGYYGHHDWAGASAWYQPSSR